MKLSSRQCGIAQCVYAGMSNNQIAKHYGLSVQTIKNHITSTMGRVGAKDRTNLAIWWHRYAVTTNDTPFYNPDKRATDSSDANKKYKMLKRNAPGAGITREQRQEIIEKYGKKCACCGSTKNIQIDHIIAISKGGADDISNVQLLCRNCNARKGNNSTDYGKN